MGHRTFANWFRGQLRVRELSQADFARTSGKQTGVVSDWATGKRTPDPQSCDLIADVFGIPIDTVLEAAGHRPRIGDIEDEQEKEMLVLFSSLSSGGKTLVLEYARFQHDLARRRSV